MYVDDSIHIEKTDQCYTCEHFIKGVMCPLLEALALGVVELTEDVTVQNCGFYRKFTRHLRVVDTTKPDEETLTAERDSAAASDHEDEGDQSTAQNRSASTS